MGEYQKGKGQNAERNIEYRTRKFQNLFHFV